MASSPLKDDKAVLNDQLGTTTSHTRASDEIVTLQKGDLLDLESVDPVLNAKMGLVNDAIDEIGFTMYQAKLFVLNGFGYVDSTFFADWARPRSCLWLEDMSHDIAYNISGDDTLAASQKWHL